jgi:hypothetical protein
MESSITTTRHIEKEGEYFKCSLVLEDGKELVIPMREDGYIFGTGLCNAASKRVSYWVKRNETLDLIKELQSRRESGFLDAANAASKFIEVIKGGRSATRKQGTWVHPDLGINLAQWCSPSFGLQVSKWVRELIITKEVKLGEEKSEEVISGELQMLIDTVKKQEGELKEKDEELMKQQEELMEKEGELEVQKFMTVDIQRRHDNHLEKRTRRKFKKGPCFYIMGNPDDCSFSKPGYSGNLSERNVYYTTALPCTVKILYACHSPDACLIEKHIQRMYKNNRQQNREGVYNVPIKDMINSVRTLLALYPDAEHEENENFADDYGHLMNKEDETYSILSEKTKKALANVTSDKKTCARCNEEKSKSEFGLDSRRPDGKGCYCKKCKVAKTLEYKAKIKMNVTEKICRKCDAVKPLEQFNVHSASKDGRHSYCKGCFKKAKKDYKKGKQEEFECPHCELMYCSKDSLGVHLRRKHSDQVQDPPNDVRQ